MHFMEMSKGKFKIHVFDPSHKWAHANDETTKNIHYHAWDFIPTENKGFVSNVWLVGQGGGSKTVPETLKELGH